MFWQVFHELPLADKKKFLSKFCASILMGFVVQDEENIWGVLYILKCIYFFFAEFLTGSDRIPIYGMSKMKVRIRVNACCFFIINSHFTLFLSRFRCSFNQWRAASSFCQSLTPASTSWIFPFTRRRSDSRKNSREPSKTARGLE